MHATSIAIRTLDVTASYGYIRSIVFFWACYKHLEVQNAPVQVLISCSASDNNTSTNPGRVHSSGITSPPRPQFDVLAKGPLHTDELAVPPPRRLCRMERALLRRSLGRTRSHRPPNSLEAGLSLS